MHGMHLRSDSALTAYIPSTSRLYHNYNNFNCTAVASNNLHLFGWLH